MGVVHKLKSEVIQFLLDAKQTHPKMGCRKLAELASDKFQTKISKSSVNSILKDANLSGSVGRPSGKAKEKKFEIPKEKKQAIRDTLSQWTKKEGVDAEKAALPEKKIEVRKDPQAILGQVQEGAGVMLLVAYYWALGHNSPLKGVFERHLQKSAPPALDAILDSLFLLILNNINKKDVLGRPKEDTFSQIYPLGFDKLKESMELILQKWEDSPVLAADYSNECRQTFQKVSGFRLIFEDGEEVFIDAQQRGVWADIHSHLPQAMRYGMDGFMESFLSQTRSFVSGALFSQSGLDAAQKRILEYSLRPQRVPLKEVVVLDGRLQEMARFPTIVQIPRQFLFGVYPHQKEELFRSKNIQWAERKRYYDCFSEEEVSLTDTFVSYEEQKVRVIGLWGGADKPQGAILTNDNTTEAALLADTFLWQLPSFFRGKTDNEAQPIEIDHVSSQDPSVSYIIEKGLGVGASLTEYIRDFIDILWIEFLKDPEWQRFFNSDVKSFISNICNISGFINVQKRVIYAHLSVSSDSPFYEGVREVTECLNKRRISSRLGKHLIFKLGNSAKK